MYRIAVVLVPGVYLYSIGGLMDAFQIANDHIDQQQGRAGRHFACQTISPTGAPVTTSNGMHLNGDVALANAGAFDLIYLPAFAYQGITAFERSAESLQHLFQWVRREWRQGTAISANCTGTFLLAETGLLDGHRATTAWWLERSFRRRYPKVDLDAHALLTEDTNLITTGAMTAHLNMTLHIIGREAGPHLAALCAKTMLIDTGPNTQRPYQELLQAELSPDPLVAKAQYWLQNHLRTSVDLAMLAEKMNVSQRTLIRHFKAELDLTPLSYLQNVRIETAKRLLERSRTPLAEVVEQVGYLDVSSFSRLFKRKTGLTPNAYRQRFSQMGALRASETA